MEEYEDDDDYSPYDDNIDDINDEEFEEDEEKKSDDEDEDNEDYDITEIKKSVDENIVSKEKRKTDFIIENTEYAQCVAELAKLYASNIIYPCKELMKIIEENDIYDPLYVAEYHMKYRFEFDLDCPIDIYRRYNGHIEIWNPREMLTTEEYLNDVKIV